MRHIHLLLLCSLFNCGFAQSFKEKELKTEIREVTVFLSSAQIFEAASVPLTAGKTSLKIKGLSPYLDEKSIQVKGDGDFTILSVNHGLNHLDALKRDSKIDSLNRIITGMDESNRSDNARLAVLEEKLSLLNENKSIGGTTDGVSIAQLKQALDLFESEVQKIKDEEIRLMSGISQRKKNSDKLQQQLKELNAQTILPASEIEIRVSTTAATTAKLRITYLVGNAGWFPKYDARVENIRKPLQITYKAEVFQNTGVDWNNVKLRFSNGDPRQTGMAPTLNPFIVGFARPAVAMSPALYGSRAPGNPDIRNVKGRIVGENGDPLPGVNILIKGTTIGTATDGSGNYSLTLPNNGPSTLVVSFIGYQTQEIPVFQHEHNISLTTDEVELSEVVVTGNSNPIRLRGLGAVKARDLKDVSRLLPTTTIENQTTVEIEVSDPYTIKSNGEKMLVDLKHIEAEALYEYFAVPKLDKDAFLVARIINWDQYNLLEGEANLYFEDAFVGRSILNAKSLSDTLDISLGRDKSIVVGREKNPDFCKRRSLGSNVSDIRDFRIVVRNKKSQPINITIFDQIPVSLVSDISVAAEELSNGTLEKTTGKVTWQLKIEPQEQKELRVNYEVRYPRRERVALE